MNLLLLLAADGLDASSYGEATIHGQIFGIAFTSNLP
jgi:hypothetical protein